MKRGFLIYLALVMASVCQAQSQPTYKCVTAGKVSYSDEPCVGATVVDITPTQGLDKITGTSKKGADVQRSEHNKLMADIFKPILRQTPEERARATKRAGMLPEENAECYMLDGQVRDSKSRNEVSLYQTRKRYKDLKC